MSPPRHREREEVIMAALARGGLSYKARSYNPWHYKRRHFRNQDVKPLIERGVAVQIGNKLVKV